VRRQATLSPPQLSPRPPDELGAPAIRDPVAPADAQGSPVTRCNYETSSTALTYRARTSAPEPRPESGSRSSHSRALRHFGAPALSCAVNHRVDALRMKCPIIQFYRASPMIAGGTAHLPSGAAPEPQRMVALSAQYYGSMRHVAHAIRCIMLVFNN
jgi:hypothetical protein